ncbi:MAG TPA: dihydroorotate dehydrogenase electron transfer subunit [Thermoleophilaceae bacterium]|nr:dihydroorotate dehydrogenase electron transfer subunit [Thermoleophilaceae bacterium]
MAAEPRTLAPPERRMAEVSAKVRLGGYDLLVAHDIAGPPDPRPGQFYMLAAGERWGGGSGERPYLPRAFSFARVRRHPDGGTELAFLLEAVGPGTHRLGQLSPGDPLALVGPLGVGFRSPAAGTRALLVGGGIGVAPLLCLHDELSGTWHEGVEVLLGFRSSEYAQAADLFLAGLPGGASPLLAVMTDDGSVGRPGLVTEPLLEGLERDPAVTVYACGPPAMLEAVRALCAERSVRAQLALESGMACGFGACFGCVAPTREGYVRICVDGPVLDAELLETALLTGAGHS